MKIIISKSQWEEMGKKAELDETDMVFDTLLPVELKEAQVAKAIVGKGASNFAQEILSNPEKYPNISQFKFSALKFLYGEIVSFNKDNSQKLIIPDIIKPPFGKVKPEYKNEQEYKSEQVEYAKIRSDKMKITISKSQWEEMGKTAGWNVEAMSTGYNEQTLKADSIKRINALLANLPVAYLKQVEDTVKSFGQNLG